MADSDLYEIYTDTHAITCSSPTSRHAAEQSHPSSRPVDPSRTPCCWEGLGSFREPPWLVLAWRISGSAALTDHCCVVVARSNRHQSPEPLHRDQRRWEWIDYSRAVNLEISAHRTLESRDDPWSVIPTRGSKSETKQEIPTPLEANKSTERRSV